jgi:ubiquinone/menaquinone biosynthesis C-methylase UbiE
MTKDNFDPEVFKINQRQSWDSVAAGWQKWWETIENGAQKVSDKLVELAEIREGQKILDIATGWGTCNYSRENCRSERTCYCYRYIHRNVGDWRTKSKISGSTRYHGICTE